MEKHSALVFALAQDPGGAAALVPGLKDLHKRPNFRLTTLAHEHACDVFESAQIPYENCVTLKTPDTPNWSAVAEQKLRQLVPDLIVTSTSFHTDFEKSFIRMSRQLKLPCLTILDSWTNFTLRFLKTAEKDLKPERLPDVITVIDHFMVQEMKELGFPESRLQVVGQPALDQFMTWSKSVDALDCRTHVRTDLGLTERQPFIVFFSQPIRALHGGPGTSTYRGYDEYSTLDFLYTILNRLNIPLSFLVKLHPKELRDKFKIRVKENSLLRIFTDQNHHDADRLIMAANLIIGMTSIVLVKSLLVGKPTLSFEPYFNGKTELIAGKMGLLKPVNEPKLLPEIIKALLSFHKTLSREKLPDTWTDGKSSSRILKIINEFT